MAPSYHLVILPFSSHGYLNSRRMALPCDAMPEWLCHDRACGSNRRQIVSFRAFHKLEP
jgi:hypothetical protein